MNIFSDVELFKTFTELNKPTPHMIASLIMLHPKRSSYLDYLKKVIEKNNSMLLDIYSTTMSIEEIEYKIHTRKAYSETFIEQTYYCLLLKFFSENIFHGEAIDFIRDKCNEYAAKFKKKTEENPDLKKYHRVELSEKLKGTETEALFNIMMFVRVCL